MAVTNTADRARETRDLVSACQSEVSVLALGKRGPGECEALERYAAGVCACVCVCG